MSDQQQMQAVLFDLDGTLVESKLIWYNLMNNCRIHFGYSGLKYNEWECTFGQSMELNRSTFFPDQTQQQINDYCDRHYIDHIQYLQIFEQSLGTLQYVAKKYNNNVVCVTNCPRPITEVILPRTNFAHLFTHVVCARDTIDYDINTKYKHIYANGNHDDSVDKHDINMQIHTNGTTNSANGHTAYEYSLQPKKAPDTLLHACTLLNIDPSTAYFVGDTKHDMEAASAAGCTGIGIGVDGGKHRIDNIGDLVNVI